MLPQKSSTPSESEPPKAAPTSRRGFVEWVRSWRAGTRVAVGSVLLLLSATAGNSNDQYVKQHNASPGLLPALLPQVLLVCGLLLIGTGAVKWWRQRHPRAADVPPPWSVPAPATKPAAWYPDPRGEARLRYWNGREWTDHTAT